MPTLQTQLATKLQTFATLARAGVVRPHRPDRLVATARALAQWGPTPAAGIAASAARFPDETAIIDDRGSLTFREVHLRTNALANALKARGLGEGDAIAIMCRNHRGFLETLTACAKLGAHAVFLNTGFSAPQLADVLAREQPRGVVYDGEFRAVLGAAVDDSIRAVAWHEAEDDIGDDPLVETLMRDGDSSELTPPGAPGKAIILTSGTTGTPKGASRRQPSSLEPAAALLSMIPMRARRRTLIAAPLFHSWGYAHFTLGLSLSTTYVLRRRFDPEQTLAAVAQHRASALVAVPVMIQRILELPESTLAAYDLPCLDVVAVSGSALPGALSNHWMDAFGDTLYNLYGSTEVAWATIATPADLRAAPGTAGRPPRGTVVRIYDDAGAPLGPGEPGRIFVGNAMAFEGYTGGGHKDVHDGLMSSGDVGHFDPDGRLFVDGRDDDMIVSGGENVFPGEVESLLAGHEALAEVAVFGVPDEQFGQRLKVVAVLRPGAEADGDAIRAFVRANLASYKVPREVEFIDELPRTSTGKVLKRALR